MYATSSGVIVSHTHPFLAATPDVSVYDPPCGSEPFGFAEIKCPYKYQDVTFDQAATNSDLMLFKEADGRLALICQVQRQIEIRDRKWCDFIVYTKRGIHVECLNFDQRRNSYLNFVFFIGFV